MHEYTGGTDYVFDGAKGSPYKPEDLVCPSSVYGRSKAEGEDAVKTLCDQSIILRTAWVYGHEGRNFVKTMLRLAQERSSLRVFSDQRGAPTFVDDLVDGLLKSTGLLLNGDIPWGTYHITGGGEASWYDFAQRIFELSTAARRVAPYVEASESIDYPPPAKRPAYSVLDCSGTEHVFGLKMLHWEDVLQSMLSIEFSDREHAVGRA